MAGQSIAGARAQLRPVQLPAGLGWDAVSYPLTGIKLLDRWGAPYATLDQTAESLFDAASTARSAPGATFYVNSGGSDAFNGLTSATAFASLWKAVQAANAAAVPSKIVVAAGTYYRANGFTNNSVVFPTVDIAFLATGGRVVTGTFDAFSAPTKDATYTNCYSWTRSNVDRVGDLARLDRFGNPADLVAVATPAICNVTAGSWCQSGSVLYVNRADGAAVTNANTRVSLVVQTFSNGGAGVNLYLGSVDGYSGFDLSGGGAGNGVIYLYMSALPGAKKVFSARNCSFSQAGGAVTTGCRGVSIDNWHGLAAFFGCRSDGNASDGFNVHRTSLSGAVTHGLSVNCSAWDNGRAPSASNQGLTTHEDVTWIDLAGDYRDNNGGSVRSIGSSKTLLAGTHVSRDRGDAWAGGAVAPTAFMVDDTATYWCDAVQADMPASTRAFFANGSGASILTRNPWPARASQGGAGAIGAW